MEQGGKVSAEAVLGVDCAVVERHHSHAGLADVVEEVDRVERRQAADPVEVLDQQN